MDHAHDNTTLAQQHDPGERRGSSEERTDHLGRNSVVFSSAEDERTENSTGCMAFDPVKYQSYKEYIAAILKTWPEYWSLHYFLGSVSAEWSKNLEFSETQLVMADCTDASAKIKVFRQGDRSVEPSMLKAALNSYNEDIKTRIIMVTPCHWVPSEMIDALGMALDVDPCFFQFAIDRIRNSNPRSSRGMRDFGPPVFETFGHFVILEPFLYAQLLQVQKDTTTRIQVVLIFATDELWHRPNHGILSYGRPSIHKLISAFPLAEHNARHETLAYPLDQRVQIFEKMLQTLDNGRFDSVNNTPLEYLCPLIRLAVQGVSSAISKLGENFKLLPLKGDDNMMLMAKSHADTIKCVESLRQLTRNLAIHYPPIAGRSSANLLDVKKYCEDVLDDGQRLCSLVHARIQIETGLASIRESQRSIEEAISVKRLTQLAFIFIPLTYTSSLFGMNIKEMNGNGPKLWIFLFISVCLSGITLVLSSIVKRLTNLVKRHYREPDYRFRSYILYDVIGLRFGLFWWMTRTGLTLTILTGGRFGSLDPLEHIEEKVQEKLSLSDGEGIWPPPRGFNKFYFRTKASSQSADDSTGS